MLLNNEKRINVTTTDGVGVPAFLKPGIAPVANTVFVHGLAGDKDEAYDLHFKAAKEISKLNVNTIRFDFRGHGESNVPSRKMDIKGEFLDLSAVLQTVNHLASLPIVFVSSSLGAVSTLLCLSRLKHYKVATAVLWNPVLDPFRTFVSPGTNWSETAFSGFLKPPFQDTVMLGGFEVGMEFWQDISNKNLSRETWSTAKTSSIPTIIFHGIEDQIVHHSISASLLGNNNNATLISYEGEGHGMGGVHDRLIAESVKWISKCL